MKGELKGYMAGWCKFQKDRHEIAYFGNSQIFYIYIYI